MVRFISLPRWLRFPLPLLLLGAPALPAAGFDGDVRPDDLLLTVRPGEWRTETVELENRSFRRVITTFPGRSAEAGRPELPVRTLLVGVPDGYRIRATVESEEHMDIPGLPVVPAGRDTITGPENIPLLLPFVDDRFYRTGRWYPQEPVSTGEPARFRHQQVVPVLVRTFQTVPSTGLLRVYEKTVVRIRFERDRTKVSGGRATETAGADPLWEEIYRNTIVNYEDARRYRTRPARTGGGEGRSKAGAGAEYRIRVGQSGLYRIDRDELAAAGMTTDPVAADITLARRGFSESLFDEGGDPFTETLMPVLVEDADGDGLFESGDAIFAWLPGFGEDRMERDFQDRFDTEAAYFLGTGGGNPPLVVRTAWHGREGLTPLPSFPDSVRWEVDATYDIGPVQDTTDLYFAYSKLHGSAVTGIDLPPPDRNGTFRVKGMTVSTLSSSNYHRYMLVHGASGDTVFNEVVFLTRPALRKSVESFPSSLLAEGTNQFTYYGSRGNSPDNTSTTGAGGFLDWYEIHASFLYEAVDDYLRFSTGGEQGWVEIEAGRFTGGEILLFDITEPGAPVRLSADSVRSAGDTLFTIVLQDTVDTGSASVRSYVAATRESARRLGDGKITAAGAASLDTEEGDYVIIAWDDFLDAVEPLALHRESEGMRVIRAPLSAVYDRFQGGVKDPRAIGRYLRYAFEKWETPPSYILLVGDGYEDYKDAAANGEETEFDFLPAYPIWKSDINPGGDHWTASDAWYVLLDGDTDYLPEMLIGRFPVGSADEARAMAEKTVLYETGRPDEAWRRRALFVADDGWTYTSGPIRNSRQTQFENGSKQLAARITGQSTVRADTSSLWLSTWTDTYHSLCPYRDGSDPDEADLICVLDLVRHTEDGITPRLFDRLNEGTFLVNFQGHGSRSSLTHELVLVEGMSYRGWYAHDITERTEPGRPAYLFMGYGCAISEFDRFKTFGDDAVGETMALFEGGGAVLAYGSTAIEFLTANLSLNDYILGRFYPVPGETDGAARSEAGRTAGALLAAGMADYAAASYYGWKTARRYAVLGDPALRIGPYAPDLALTVDGETVEEGAIRIPGADGAPMVMEAYFFTDLLVQEDGIVLSDGGTTVDDSLFLVTQGEDGESGRWIWAVRYERNADETPGAVQFRFTDADGSIYTRTIQTGVEIGISFDGDAYADSLVVPTITTLKALLPAGLPVDRADIRAAGDGFDMEADTLYGIDDSTVAVEIELVLPEGIQTIRLNVGGLSWPVTLNVMKSAVEIAVTVDGDPSPNGSSLLGHIDGTPPEIVALVGEPRDLSIESIVLIDGEDTLGTDMYELVPDTIGGDFYRRLTYRPALRNDDYVIRIEATESEGGSAVFLLHVSMPITLFLDGVDLIDGDFSSPEASARAEVVYAGSLPPDEVRFLFDGAPLPLDTLRREGANRWIAAATVEAEGGAHTVAFHAGAFGKSVSFRVEDRLRVVEPLVYPNPLEEGEAGLFYHLTLAADEVRAEIFTVTGRRIRVLTGLSGRAGYNVNESVWNGRDQDGDRLARGVYPFRIIASRGGENAEAIGKIVIR